jgi:hypothetical protein
MLALAPGKGTLKRSRRPGQTSELRRALEAGIVSPWRAQRTHAGKGRLFRPQHTGAGVLRPLQAEPLADLAEFFFRLLQQAFAAQDEAAVLRKLIQKIENAGLRFEPLELRFDPRRVFVEIQGPADQQLHETLGRLDHGIALVDGIAGEKKVLGIGEFPLDAFENLRTLRVRWALVHQSAGRHLSAQLPIDLTGCHCAAPIDPAPSHRNGFDSLLARVKMRYGPEKAMNQELPLLRGFLAQLVQRFGHEEIDFGQTEGLGVLAQHGTNKRRKGAWRRENDQGPRKRRCHHATQENVRNGVRELALSDSKNIFNGTLSTSIKVSSRPILSIHPNETSPPFWPRH